MYGLSRVVHEFLLAIHAPVCSSLLLDVCRGAVWADISFGGEPDFKTAQAPGFKDRTHQGQSLSLKRYQTNADHHAVLLPSPQGL